MLLGLKEESEKLLFVQFITEYAVYFYSKGIEWLGEVMCILWNRSFSAVVKISRWLRLFLVKKWWFIIWPKAIGIFKHYLHLIWLVCFSDKNTIVGATKIPICHISPYLLNKTFSFTLFRSYIWSVHGKWKHSFNCKSAITQLFTIILPTMDMDIFAILPLFCWRYIKSDGDNKGYLDEITVWSIWQKVKVNYHF